jgi:hypothetical protein
MLGIVATMMSASLYYFIQSQYRQADLQDSENSMSSNSTKTGNIAEVWVVGPQISAIFLGYGAVFFGLISAGLFYSYSKIISGGILLVLGLFLLFYVLVMFRVCAPHTQEFDFVPVCTLEYFVVPSLLIGASAILIAFGIKKNIQSKR